MKYVDEYRDAEAVQVLARAIQAATTSNWTIMEICGGQTHSIVKFGIDQLLPDKITLVHGPGCPVCVTPVALIDKALFLAQQKDVILCSFGDMLRVPGSTTDLLSVKAEGADVRMVYSPLNAVEIATKNPDKKVVFFAVGFETTAPANAMAAIQAKALGLENFSLLVSHVTVPPAIEAILSSPDNRIQGFLAAGHVCTVMGYWEYHDLAARHNVPIVVTGFEPVDILKGILQCVQHLEEGKSVVDNAYERAVQEKGNPSAIEMIRTVFKQVDRDWRGIGEIPMSGLGLQDSFEQFDAEVQFQMPNESVPESPECISGLIMRGAKKPHECPAFGKGCTPEHPLGAPMVSSEGACSAYYRYRNQPA